MEWEKPWRYSKSQLNKTGDVLISNTSTDEEKGEALDILNNWRAIHSYPMHVFKVRLKDVSKRVDNDALTAQRLKRVPAIIKKLSRSYEGRPPTMKLSQMQDIGGCRAVLTTVEQARKLCNDYYLKGDLKHKKVGMKDYIANPKKDGYRSIHLIYRYNSDKERKKIYNGLLVEVQIRSKLQHIWATAIETVDFFARQAIKSNEGEEEWMNFFRLVGSAFAKEEHCPLVPNTPIEGKELYSQIKKKEAELNVRTIMSGWTNAMRVFEEYASKSTSKAQFFLLELDIVGKKMALTAYPKRQEGKAIEDYAKAEKRNKEKKEFDVVLVGVDTIGDLKKAYPNYFVDTREFLIQLQKIIKKAG